jgi:two-component system, OmpR family, phosphate regulon sensor histidine kinase PhoR
MDFDEDVHDELSPARWTYPPERPRGAAQVEDTSLLIDGALHALRTRLTTVKGYGQLLSRVAERPTLDQDTVVALMTELNSEIDGLEEVVQQFLGACQLQWDRRPLDWNAVDLSLLVHQAVERVAAPPLVTPQHQIHISERQHVTGIWDARWLGEALAALVMNALRFSPDGGLVQIDVAQQGPHAAVTVRDQGLGIQPDECERIFLPFVTGSAAERVDERPGGWGLGLFITGKVVTTHAARLEIESIPERGSSVTLLLPLVPQVVRTVAD